MEELWKNRTQVGHHLLRRFLNQTEVDDLEKWYVVKYLSMNIKEMMIMTDFRRQRCDYAPHSR